VPLKELYPDEGGIFSIKYAKTRSFPLVVGKKIFLGKKILRAPLTFFFYFDKL
jgi:hypothetical protein